MKKAFLKTFGSALVATIVSTVIVSVASAAVIDDYSVGAYLQGNGTTQSLTQSISPSVFTTRSITYFGRNALDNVWDENPPTTLTFANGQSTSNSWFASKYYSSGPVDLAALGSTFKFEVTASDLPTRLPPVTLPVTITVVDGLSVSQTASVPVSLAGFYTLPFSAFGLVDLTSVSSVTFGMASSNTKGVDITFDDLVIIPEPSTCALLLIGVGGLLALARRRNR